MTIEEFWNQAFISCLIRLPAEEAKTEATKQRRLDTAVEWIGEGKPRMWKYMKK